MAAPTVVNLTLTNSNGEYSYLLPAGTANLTFQCRTSVDVRFAFASGVVNGSSPAGPYGTCKSGTGLTLPMNISPTVSDTASYIYFACGTGGSIMEIITS